MNVNTSWVENKFRELSNDPEFIRFLDKQYSSRDGFISFMPNDTAGYESILDPSNNDYWKVVSAIVTYIVNQDTSIRDDVTYDMVEYITGNSNYVTFSMFEIF